MERLESEESISTNLNSALVALMALDVYLDPNLLRLRGRRCRLAKTCAFDCCIFETNGKGENPESMNRVDADLNVLFVQYAQVP